MKYARLHQARPFPSPLNVPRLTRCLLFLQYVEHTSFLAYGVGLSFLTLGVVGMVGGDDVRSLLSSARPTYRTESSSLFPSPDSMLLHCGKLLHMGRLLSARDRGQFVPRRDRQ